MISDILLLVAVFENFRKTCLQYYKLPRCHYFKRPGLSWDAMLKMTDIKLELMVDIDMYQFIEKSMRGGISYIANRYRKTNNKYMKTYDKKAPLKYSWLVLSRTKKISRKPFGRYCQEIVMLWEINK